MNTDNGDLHRVFLRERLDTTMGLFSFYSTDVFWVPPGEIYAVGAVRADAIVYRGNGGGPPAWVKKLGVILFTFCFAGSDDVFFIDMVAYGVGVTIDGFGVCVQV